MRARFVACTTRIYTMYGCKRESRASQGLAGPWIRSTCRALQRRRRPHTNDRRRPRETHPDAFSLVARVFGYFTTVVVVEAVRECYPPAARPMKYSICLAIGVISGRDISTHRTPLCGTCFIQRKKFAFAKVHNALYLVYTRLYYILVFYTILYRGAK